MYQADEKRYETMHYNRCGNSGLLLPELSLGLWHNFGTHCDYFYCGLPACNGNSSAFYCKNEHCGFY